MNQQQAWEKQQREIARYQAQRAKALQKEAKAKKKMSYKMLKAQLKNYKATARFLYKLFWLFKRRDIINEVIKKAYDLLDIKYEIKEISYKEEWVDNDWYQTFVIGYFEINSIKNWEYHSKMNAVQFFVGQLIEQNMIAYCTANNINPRMYFESDLLWKKMKWWIQWFSNSIGESICNYTLQYYHRILTVFDQSFEKKWLTWYLIDQSFLTDQRKNQLFKEIKVSQAKKQFVWALAWATKNKIKEIIIQSKDQIGYSLDVFKVQNGLGQPSYQPKWQVQQVQQWQQNQAQQQWQWGQWMIQQPTVEKDGTEIF